MPILGKKIPIQIAAGVMPITDATNLETLCYTKADKVRFQYGKLRKLMGWVRQLSNNNQRLRGAIRTLYDYLPSDGIKRTIIGTSSRLYVYQQGNFYNITPLNVTTIPITNSLSTIYYTDSSYSVTTTAGSDIVTFNIPHYLNPGDLVEISGVTGTIGGVPSTDFNNTFVVINIPTSNSFTVIVPVIATSTQTGGGAGITFATSQLLISLSNHGLNDGDRIKITGASNVNGILAASINKENIVETVISNNVFIIQTDTIATSLVVNGGGTATLQKQIAPGPIDQSLSLGYGGGFYGIGLYGIPKEFSTGFIYPRIWSIDLFGDNIVLTPGNSGPVYLWQNNPDVAPTILTNAPTTVNWVFQSHGMVCVLYATTMQSSNIGNATDWTLGPASTGTIFSVPGASQFIGQSGVRNIDLLFTISAVYEQIYIKKPFVWDIRELFLSDGIIGPRAHVAFEDAIYWMGQHNFYIFKNDKVEVLPNNTVQRYVFDNINASQSYKSFAAISPSFNEVFWFYPSDQNDEPNSYVIYNYREQHWTIGTIERTAAVESSNAIVEVLMAQSNVQMVSNVINNGLSSNFYTLNNNPLTTTNSSNQIIMTINNHKLYIGDNINIAGSSTVNGILAANINGVRPITAITINTVTFTAGSNASASGSGGGSSITVGTQILTVTSAQNFQTGDIVTLSDFSIFNDFNEDEINSTFTVRNFGNGFFDIAVTTDYSTAQVSGGGEFGKISFIRTGRLFQHEVGYNDYDDVNCDINNPDTCIKPLESFAETNYMQIDEGDFNMLIYSVIPDSTQQGSMELTVYTKLYPQINVESTKGPFIINTDTSKIDIMALGRQRKYKIYSNVLDQNFIVGKWYEQIKPTTPI
jgi:hypothetical protein